MTHYYVGLMSGTSADAIDSVLVESGTTPRLIAAYSNPMPDAMRSRIHDLSLPGSNEIDRMGSLDIELGHEFAACVLTLLARAGKNPEEIAAIGSHGQTIRHRPPESKKVAQPFTLQIGDPNTIAQHTGITTVADFRRRDMAAGGQGAPLVPGFHQAIFQSSTRNRVIVNIGGMANITWLPSQGSVTGFDTGPGNVLMDGWIKQHTGKSFDKNGCWALSGNTNTFLLDELLNHNFFTLSPPKSTGREAFNLDWLQSCLNKIPQMIAPVDVQATLLQFTARSIALHINHLSSSAKEVIICGGGAYNQALISSLQQILPNDRIHTSGDFGIAPEWVEAMAFAWLAEQTLMRKPGNLRAVTGAHQEVILGGIYYA